MESALYACKANDIKGREISLGKYAGKVLLIVNTASKCGFTPQYAGLEKLHEKYKDKGLAVLGFPCNQFGAQEPDDETEIQKFCELNYDVKFPMFAKVDVNGANTHPVYSVLKSAAKGLMGTEGIKWNFTKFLVDRNGKVVERYAPTTKPEDMAEIIEGLL